MEEYLFIITAVTLYLGLISIVGSVLSWVGSFARRVFNRASDFLMVVLIVEFIFIWFIVKQG